MQDRKLNDLPINDLISTSEFVQLIFEFRDYAIDHHEVDPDYPLELGAVFQKYLERSNAGKVDLPLFAELWAHRSLVTCTNFYMHCEVEFIRKVVRLANMPEVMVLALGFLPKYLDDYDCLKALDNTSVFMKRRLTYSESRVLEVLMKGIPKMRRMAWRWT